METKVTKRKKGIGVYRSFIADCDRHYVSDIDEKPDYLKGNDFINYAADIKAGRKKLVIKEDR